MHLFNGRKKRREKLLAAWGKRKNFSANQYYERQLFDQKNYEYSIDEETAEDLDFARLFNFADRTTSIIGQQCLYERLRLATVSEEDRKQLESAIDFYRTSDKVLLLEQLARFEQHKDYIYPTIFYAEVPKVTRYRQLIRLLQLVSFACLLFGFSYPFLWVIFVPFMAINLFVHYRIKQEMGLFVDVFSRLGILHNIAEKLLPLSHHQVGPAINTLMAEVKQLEKSVRKLKFLSLDEELSQMEGVNVFAYLMEVIKFSTLLDVVTYYALLDNLSEIRGVAMGLYHAIGEVDVALSVLALRTSLPYFTQPFLSDTNKLKVTGIYHPLIDEPVANDLVLQTQGMLVTGSNMSGKSTFIKTLNINAICAQTLNTAFATSYSSRNLRIVSSMNTRDDLFEGSSYYLQEVQRIKHLITLSESEQTSYLITIDEVFRGTNTLERISSAKAVLEYLIKHGSLVLVSTHDLELAELLNEKYALYYFQEAIRDEALSFDYKLKQGIMTERNAIKILRLTGYPQEVVDEAERLSLSRKV